MLLPLAYLPPVQYFAILVAADEVWIEQHETYPKQTFRNRCEIYSANGKLPLSIPVEKINGNHTMTRDIRISDHQNWQAAHWRAIRSAYANSPFFLYYQDEILPFYQKKFTGLLEFNLEILQKIMELTGTGKRLKLTQKFEKHPEGILDFRREITPKKGFTFFQLDSYYQTFEEKHGFIPGLSVIDLLFNLGEESLDYILRQSEKI